MDVDLPDVDGSKFSDSDAPLYYVILKSFFFLGCFTSKDGTPSFQLLLITLEETLEEVNLKNFL